MHELSIATALTNAATDAVQRARETRPITAVTVRIGDLAGVVEDALRFAWPVAAEGTPCEGAELRIERAPGLLWCDACNAEARIPSPPRFRCATCGKPSADIRGGHELDLISLELADEAPDHQTHPTTRKDTAHATAHP